MTISHDKTDYARFYTNWSAAPLCCAPWYLDAVIDQGSEWAAVTLLENGQAFAAWVYFSKQRWGMRYVTMPHFTKHMGLLVRPEWTQTSVLTQLLAALPQQAGIDQQWHPSANAWVERLPAYWQVTAHYLHRIDLNQDWRVHINRNMRRNIRKAAGQLQLQDDIDLTTFYRINQLSFARQELAMPYTNLQLERHDAALAKQGRRRIFAAVDEQGRIHSVAYLMWDDQAAYYHLSGDDPALRKSGAGIWLIAQALDYSQKVLQLPIFDFEGSMLPAVAKIREQFGAQRHTYYRVQQAQDIRYRLLKWWRE